MEDTPIPQSTRRYAVVAWTLAVIVGVAVGLGAGFLTRDLWVGIVVGAAGVALLGLAAMAAARQTGRGTNEDAPPWTGEAGIRHHGGGPI